MKKRRELLSLLISQTKTGDGREAVFSFQDGKETNPKYDEEEDEDDAPEQESAM